MATYALLPRQILHALAPWRALAVGGAAALLGASAQYLLASYSGILRRVGRTSRRFGTLFTCIALVVAGWLLVRALPGMLTLPFGRQLVGEVSLVPLALASVGLAACMGQCATGEHLNVGTVIAVHVTPPLTVVCLALRSDYPRFALMLPADRVYVAALFVGAALMAAASAAIDARRRIVRAVAFAVLAASVVVLVAFDAAMLRRLYPELHLAAWLGAVVAASRLAASAARPGAVRCVGWVLPVSAALCVGAASSDAVVRYELLGRVGPLGRIARTVGVRLGPWTLGPVVPIVRAYAATPRRHVDTRPCVVLVTVDALRADRLSPAMLPSMMSWADRGFRFTAARTPYPGTHRAFHSVLSGQLPFFGAPDWTGIVGRFRDAGYRTIAVGELKDYSYVNSNFDVVDRPPSRDDAWSGRRFSAYVDGLPAEGPPLLAWLHLDRPHAPYRPSTPSRALGSPRELYDACVRDTDLVLHAVVEALDRLSARRPTVVVFFADHGEEFGEHGGEYHRSSVYDEQLRVPLVLAGASVSTGASDLPVSLVDVGPTLLDAAGLGIPGGLNGRSLLPVIRGESLDAQPVVSVLFDQQRGDFLCLAAVYGEWKLTVDRVAGTLALFDLSDDPGEYVNRISDARMAPSDVFDALSLPDPGGD